MQISNWFNELKNSLHQLERSLLDDLEQKIFELK